MSKDYYQILGIDKKASKDDIKKAFRQLAHKFHPDKKGGNADKFKELNEAYSVLSDDKKRAEYDSYGRVFSDAGSGSGPTGGFDFSGFSDANFAGFDIGDIFSEFFGKGTGYGSARGRDISIDVEVTFAESVFGSQRKLLLNKSSTCQDCSGSGATPKTEMVTCTKCNGNGKVRENKRILFGTFSAVAICSNCRGKGKIPKDNCKTCHGLGVLRKEEEIAVNIPPGLDDGEVIKIAGSGEAVSGGIAGDLYIKIHVQKHPLFRKEGNNITTNLNIKLSTALLGGEYKLVTLDGETVLKIPSGIMHGEILRLKGKGVPYEKNKRGDLLIKLSIQLPNKLSKEARSLVEGLKQEGI